LPVQSVLSEQASNGPVAAPRQQGVAPGFAHADLTTAWCATFLHSRGKTPSVTACFTRRLAHDLYAFALRRSLPHEQCSATPCLTIWTKAALTGLRRHLSLAATGADGGAIILTNATCRLPFSSGVAAGSAAPRVVGKSTDCVTPVTYAALRRLSMA